MRSAGMSSHDIAPTPPTGSNGSSSPPGVARKRLRSFTAIARGRRSVRRAIHSARELAAGALEIVTEAYDPELGACSVKLILHATKKRRLPTRLASAACAVEPNVVAVTCRHFR